MQKKIMHGRKEGRKEVEEGRKEGSQGRKVGRKEGSQGRKDGRTEGRNEGRKEAKEERESHHNVIYQIEVDYHSYYARVVRTYRLDFRGVKTSGLVDETRCVGEG